MSEHDNLPERSSGSSPVDLSKGHVEGTGGLPARFDNPGLPAHVHRHGDDDDAAARRSERQVAGLFVLSMLATVGFAVAYFAIDKNSTVTLPLVGVTNALHVALGVTLGLSLLGIGLGAVHWAKTLMSDEEVVEERHVLRSDDEARQGAIDVLTEGGESAQIRRRPLIVYTLGGALGLFAVPLGLQLVGSLGPLPKNDLSTTLWSTRIGQRDGKGGRKRKLMRDPEGTAIRLTDVTLGSVFHVLPEGINETEHPLNEKVKASVILVRLEESKIRSQRQRDWGIDGVVAYSKICTHVGCPVGLYEQQTHHLLCPCHQSTFDMTDDCKVIFGPAKRPLPQLKISVDTEGYLVADQGFAEPVGPSFWERG
ncbi:Rieske 2Fe-2S domain-containing protein [Luteipulveratus sp. YIM 133132]|uniref:cytochrome bc1 complex Rieske iron-sulfur subunit n=1 Tax=Luteipulveratus flavus TaxID=3031728 RepID=UPI0023AEF9A8|nr:Rieske 2Fe-2S domain-containing protein [Luteipulveratus sp. YIM 133132]MDE9366745.1 Rieske 2Fe-2S domain-containing protein [Luteipulveratus sp. YIM 133132]